MSQETCAYLKDKSSVLTMLQRVAVCCSVLQCDLNNDGRIPANTSAAYSEGGLPNFCSIFRKRISCILLQFEHVAANCNALQRTASHCNAMQRTAMHCSTLQCTAAHCNALQHNAIYYSMLQRIATRCDMLQKNAITLMQENVHMYTHTETYAAR